MEPFKGLRFYHSLTCSHLKAWCDIPPHLNKDSADWSLIRLHAVGG